MCGPAADFLPQATPTPARMGGDDGGLVCLGRGRGVVLGLARETGEIAPTNASLRALATALLAYARICREPRHEATLASARAAVHAVDPDCLGTGRFWARHLG